jgi:hypothetical protein
VTRNRQTIAEPSQRPRPTDRAPDADSHPQVQLQDAIGGAGPNLRAFTSVGVRSLILIAVTLILILIVLPAALVAAGS